VFSPFHPFEKGKGEAMQTTQIELRNEHPLSLSL